jgi:chitin disaccharide deacetylase
MNNLHINADDFGYNSSVNKAIIESFHKGLITSTTIMANMPGFDDAVILAEENEIKHKIGIHLVLTEGKPLTDKILGTPLFFNENNRNLKKHKKNLFFLKPDEKRLIYNEFSSQIERVRKAGIQINHIDTHHHIDEVWSISVIIMDLLKAYSIPSMRVLYNLNSSGSIPKGMYRKIVNSYIKMRGLNFSDYLGNQIEAVSKLNEDWSLIERKRLEIMVHPDYDKTGMLIDKIKNREYPFEYPKELIKLIALNTK